VRPSIDIRRAEPKDGPLLVGLCRQLGYQVTLEQVLDHLGRHREQAGHCLLVALLESAPVGWLEVSVRDALESGRWAEISGLVVLASHHSRGVGTALVQAARAWAHGQGLARLRVRTRIDRERAAGFYERLGFRLRKQQRVYEMDL
jgi:GNAT superfamily N-acetyltransferase